jgi:hypothetical protein
VSTPYAKQGVLYRDFKDYFGRDDAEDVLVWRAPSALMNPAISEDRLGEEQRLMDPTRFEREFQAEFADAAEAWLPSELIESAVDVGVRERAPQPGIAYKMAIDPSGGGRCGFAMSIVHVERRGDLRVVVQDLARVWMKGKGGKIDLGAIVSEIKDIGVSYNGCKAAYSDKYGGVWPVQRFRDAGFTLLDPIVIKPNEAEVYLHKSDAFYECGPLFRTGTFRLLDVSVQTRELRNLEARPMEGGRIKIGKPPARGESDDMANALCLAAAMAASVRAARPAGGAIRNSGLGAGMGAAGGGGRTLQDSIAKYARGVWGSRA